MIDFRDAIRVGRSLIGTPYSELDCINFIKKIIRSSPGGVPDYTTAGTNSLWNSYDMAAKYKDLTYRQEGLDCAFAGMLAFKRSGTNVHHVGLVTGEGTVLHSSSALGAVVETSLYNSQWALLAKHRYISVGEIGGDEPMTNTDDVLYKAIVLTQKDPLRVRNFPETGEIVGHVPRGAVVDVLDTSNVWPRIRFNELQGYASPEYLQHTTASGTSTPSAPSGEQGGDTVTIERARIIDFYKAARALLDKIGNIAGVD